MFIVYYCFFRRTVFIKNNFGFVATKCGREKLIIGGYQYTRTRSVNNKRYRQCTNNNCVANEINIDYKLHSGGDVNHSHALRVVLTK